MGHRLIHGNSPNLTARPRIAFYLTMHPAGVPSDVVARRQAVESGDWLYGDSRYPGFSCPDPSEAPRLTDHGKRIVGIA